MPSEPTRTQLMNAIVDLQAAVMAGFAQVDARFDRLESRVTKVAGDVTFFKGEVRGLQRWMVRSDERFAAIELHISR